MVAYYNEIDPFAANWLRNLIKAGLIAPGDVDERSIEDVAPIDLEPYIQCHFFAGVGGWSYALRLAGWPDDRPVWTGSCPCQPFSAAGKGEGFADERHLWPAWFWLVRQSRPGVIFGEQVASKLGLSWFDVVSADLESQGYTVGAVDLCAAGVGAPHIRQRLWFVADAEHNRPQRQQQAGPATATVDGYGVGELADTTLTARRGKRQSKQRGYKKHGRSSPTSGPWHPADWLPCRDGRARPIEPGVMPLVNGAPARVGRLRGYGNAIVPQVGAEFIRAYMELCEPV